MKAIYQDIKPLAKIGVIALVALLSLMVFLIISAVLAIPLFGAEAFTQLVSSSLQFDASNINLLKYFQLTQSIGMFIVPSLVLSILFGKHIGKYLMLNLKPALISIVLAILIVVGASPLINVIGIWNAEMSLPSWLAGIEEWMKQSEASATKLTELFIHTESIGGLFFNIFMIALIPAIGEEFLFRGIIQRVLGEATKNKHVAVWLTAIVFSALHLQFYGFLPRAILGAMFGYLLIWSGNLWLPVIAHFINNGMAVVAYYLYDKGTINFNPDDVGTNSNYDMAAIIGLLIVISLFVVFYSLNKRQKPLEI